MSDDKKSGAVTIALVVIAVATWVYWMGGQLFVWLTKIECLGCMQ